MRITILLFAAFAQTTVNASQIALTNGTETCIVDTLGGRVLSYCVEGKELLWRNESPIQVAEEWAHGGIPIAWPWFGRIGAGDAHIHGYAWKREFRVTGRTDSQVVLSLETESLLLKYEIELAHGLSLCVETTSKSDFPYPMSVAFHPYFLVGERDRVSVEGIDAVAVSITNAVDRSVKFEGAAPYRIYRIYDAVFERTICIEAQNSTGVNLWNPGSEMNCPGAIPRDAWRRFVSIEPFAAGINRLLVLEPHGKHVLRMKAISSLP